MNPTVIEPEVLTVNRRQVTVRHTDSGAARLCERSTSGFARIIAGEFFNYQDRADPTPFRRRGWLHLLAQEQEFREQNPQLNVVVPQQAPEPPMSLVGPMPRIFEFLRRPVAVPRQNRKNWGVEFESGDLLISFTTGIHDQSIRIWGRSRKPDGGLYGRPVAKIDAVGDLYISPECEAAFTALMDEFESNPDEFVTAYGKKTGRCCFCRLKLTDPRSEEVGYGKVCAGHYRLPWGNKS